MAWTDPAAHVYVTGEVVTAATLNTYVRLNLQALYDAPFCRANNNTNIVIPSGAHTALALPAERWDNDAMHSTTVNTSRLTATTPGAYVMGGGMVFPAVGGGGLRLATIRANGVTQIAQHGTPVGAQQNVSVSSGWRLAAGEYIELLAYQDSGANMTLTGFAAVSTEFWMARVSS